MVKINKSFIRVSHLLPAALWGLVLLSLLMARHALGDEAFSQGIAAGVLAQAAGVVWLLAQAWGWPGALRAGAGILILTWLAEFAGSSWGFPFGQYHYSNLLRPQVLGVPLWIPLAWLMMLPPSWAAASALLGKHARRRLVFALVSAAALTAWDLLLDPQMVAWGFWGWNAPSGYFGIPWSNYLGWLVLSGAITLLFGRPDVPGGPLLLLYGLTWGLQSVGQAFFWGQPGPALVGFGVMGIFLIGALARSGRLAQILNPARRDTLKENQDGSSDIR